MRAPEWRFGIILASGIFLTPMRLNPHALLGAQSGDVPTIRALWAIQDRLALTPGEEKAIGLRRELVAGQERVVCNPKRWNSCEINSDRQWFEPLLKAVPGSERKQRSDGRITRPVPYHLLKRYTG